MRNKRRRAVAAGQDINQLLELVALTAPGNQPDRHARQGLTHARSLFGKHQLVRQQDCIECKTV